MFFAPFVKVWENTAYYQNKKKTTVNQSLLHKEFIVCSTKKFSMIIWIRKQIENSSIIDCCTSRDQAFEKWKDNNLTQIIQLKFLFQSQNWRIHRLNLQWCIRFS